LCLGLKFIDLVIELLGELPHIRQTTRLGRTGASQDYERAIVTLVFHEGTSLTSVYNVDDFIKYVKYTSLCVLLNSNTCMSFAVLSKTILILHCATIKRYFLIPFLLALASGHPGSRSGYPSTDTQRLASDEAAPLRG
jgi:hypothetical protein